MFYRISERGPGGPRYSRPGGRRYIRSSRCFERARLQSCRKCYKISVGFSPWGIREMAQENSFDIVSKVEIQEVRNAIDQALKEIRQRFDLKDSNSEVKLAEGDKEIQLASDGEYHLEAVKEILGQKLVKRGVSLKNVTYGKLEPALGKSVRQKISLQQGIPIEKAKEIVRLVKDSKKKAQASIQGDTVRVSSKDRDELQGIIALLRGREMGLELQFTNYRTN